MSKKGRGRIPVKPAAQQPSAIHQIATRQESWQGPLPPPNQLAQFNEVVPGLAERIVQMAEAEGAHSREVQMRAVRATVRLQHLGQAFAFLLASGAMASSVYLAMNDHDAAAAVLFGGTLATVVLAFLNARKNK